MFKKLSTLTLAVTLALTLVGSAFAQSGGRGDSLSFSYSESGRFAYRGEGGEFISGSYSESGRITFGGNEGSTFVSGEVKISGALQTSFGSISFEMTTKFNMELPPSQQQPRQQREERKPPTIVRWLIASKKPKPPFPRVVFITEIEKVYHADDECPKILLKRNLPITLKQALEWEYEPCPVCVKETK
jgi:hypothetical protein